MRGVTLFLEKLHDRPVTALVDLTGDYATFVMAVAFSCALAAGRYPLAAAERATGLPVRATLIRAVGRLAHG